MKPETYHEKLKRTEERGFTVVELMVSIFVIVLVSGLLVVNLRSGDETLALQRAARKVAQDIRRAAELTLQTEFVTCGGGETLDGYGIRFENDTDFDISSGSVDGTRNYLLYAECNDNFEYDDGDDTDIELVRLEKGVKLKDLLVNGASNTGLGIAFEPPDPTVHLDPDNPPLEIILQVENDPNRTKTIKINKGGFIDIN